MNRNKIINTLSCLFLYANLGLCQVSNDSCLSALELMPAFGDNIQNCSGLSGFDIEYSATNKNSFPNSPYPAMTGCYGYTNSTSNYANDIWFKFKTLGFIIYLHRFNNGLDTIHLNVWRGNDCATLKPSGCFTFDMLSKLDQFADFCGDTTNDHFTFLQFSGNGINKTGDFEFCIKGVPCNYVWYYGTTNIEKVNDINIHEGFAIYPNPLTSISELIRFNEFENVNITIMNMQGQIIHEYNTRYGQKLILNREDFETGIYFIEMKKKNILIKTIKLLVL